jgi:hypothetical protein
VLTAAAVAGALLTSGIPLCPFAFLSGTPCPGCGLTRAGLCLLAGDVSGAFALSPASPLVIPFVGFVVARGAFLYVTGRPTPPSRWVTRGAIALWALLVVIWAVRFAGLLGGPVPVTSLRG